METQLLTRPPYNSTQAMNQSQSPASGRVQGQLGWSFEEPGVVEGVPAHFRGVELDGL